MRLPSGSVRGADDTSRANSGVKRTRVPKPYGRNWPYRRVGGHKALCRARSAAPARSPAQRHFLAAPTTLNHCASTPRYKRRASATAPACSTRSAATWHRHSGGRACIHLPAPASTAAAAFTRYAASWPTPSLLPTVTSLPRTATSCYMALHQASDIGINIRMLDNDIYARLPAMYI